MFSFESDAGKVSLSYLFSSLEKDGFRMFDTQALNSTTWELGAYEISKVEYLKRELSSRMITLREHIFGFSKE
jgi:Leu/Phe-tRNA-protein transferase